MGGGKIRNELKLRSLHSLDDGKKIKLKIENTLTHVMAPVKGHRQKSNTYLVRLEVSSELCAVSRSVSVHLCTVLDENMTVYHERWSPQLARMAPNELGKKRRLEWTPDEIKGSCGLGWRRGHDRGSDQHNL